MNIDGIKLMFTYDRWADERILAACKRVTPEQYVTQTGTGVSHKSLRGTMVHLVESMSQWRMTFEGYYAEPLPSEADYDATELHEEDLPTLDDWIARWESEHARMRAYIETLDDAKLAGTLLYVIPGYVRERVLWHCLVHLVNHGTQHRSEAAALLTHFGQSPGDIDFTMFLNEHFRLDG